ncbi:MAG: acetyl-CoA C-acyltransferase [Pirellulales bacterium]|nr:acetyl-CoA C-acyltransferase [Pirellulales bacterium]
MFSPYPEDKLVAQICIVAARRTPQGRLGGALARLSATELAVAAGRAALENIGPEHIDRVIVGNVLGAGLGMNVARQIGLRLAIPLDRPAMTVNMMCASGMQAVILAVQSILAGESRAVLCGGAESMSGAPYLLDRARGGYRLGDGALIDGLLRDGLVDPTTGQHMGLSAERLAERYTIDQAAQDAFAVRSQARTAAAYAEGHYRAELVPLAELAEDEHPRPNTTIEQLASLRPAFKPDGTVTAGNASGINDGAAMLVVCDGETAKERGWQRLATLGPFATAGCEPELMGLGPVHATRRLCRQNRINLDAFDMIEINEAFASQTLACMKELALGNDRVNVDGGAIALGHPIGASGARLAVHLAHAIFQGRSTRALATLCVGGGMGAAMVLER